MNKTTLARLGLAISGMTIVAGTASAASGPVELRQDLSLPPAARAHLSKLMAGRAAPKRAAQAVDTWIKVDIDPPVLTAFKGDAEVEVSQVNAQWRFNYRGTDDLAGVAGIWVQLTGPNGEWAYGNASLGFSSRDAKGEAAIDLNNITTAGVWTIYNVQLSDANNNSRIYYASELEAMGVKTQFTVKNKYYDGISPDLVEGRILTTQVVLSKPARGQYNGYPEAGLVAKFIDTGVMGVSGVHVAQAAFCHVQDLWSCLYLSGDTTVRGKRDETFRMLALVSPSAEVGDYQLQTLSITDFAGNSKTLTSVLSGGDTDFSQYFKSTIITLLP